MNRALASPGNSGSLPEGHAVAGPRPWFPRSFVVSDRVDGLERFFDDAVSVCIWRRPADQAIDTYLKEAVPVFSEDRIARVSSLQPRFEDLLSGLAPRPDCAAFQSELHGLLDLFRTLADCSLVGVRLSSNDVQSCPRFHVDRVGLRMVCTWRGPGTEWLEHAAVDRRFLKGAAHRPPDAESGLLRRGAQIYQMQPFDVGVFKGELWPDNEARGAAHRSPRVSPGATPRMRVTLDAR